MTAYAVDIPDPPPPPPTPPPPTPPVPRRPLNTSGIGQRIPVIIGTHKVQGWLIWGEAPNNDLGYVSANFAFSFTYNLFDLTTRFLEIRFDDERVYSETGQVVTLRGRIRRYVGTTTQDADPLIVDVEGEDVTPAWRGLNYLVGDSIGLDRYQDRIPICWSIVSNSYTTNSTGSELTNTALHTSLVQNDGLDTYSWTVDWSLGRIYGILMITGGAIYATVHDISAGEEVSCEMITGIPDNSEIIGQLHPLRGSGYAVGHLETEDARLHLVVIDMELAEAVASIEFTGQLYVWQLCRSFVAGSGVKYYVFGTTLGTRVTIAVFDPATRDFSFVVWHRNTGTTLVNQVAPGISANGYAQFYRPTATNIEEWSVFADGASSRVCYTPASGTIETCWYDAVTDRLIVQFSNETIRRVNPRTGVEEGNAVTVTTNARLVPTGYNSDNGTATGHIANLPEGFGLLRLDSTPDQFWLVDPGGDAEDPSLISLSISISSSFNRAHDLSTSQGFFLNTSDVWELLPVDSYVGADVSIQTILTVLMQEEGFTVGELSFSGLTGITVRALVLTGDTTTRDVVRSICTLFGIYFCESGTGIRFVRPATDESFSSDFTIVEDDLCQMESGGELVSLLEQHIAVEHETPSIIELEHIDPDADYSNAITVAEMPTEPVATTTSAKKERLSVPLSMPAATAKRWAMEYLFRRFLASRSFRFKVGPEHARLEPGDVGTVTCDGVTHTVIIQRATLGADYTQEINAVSFLKSVTSSHSAASPTVLTRPAPVRVNSRYLQLDLPLLTSADDGGGTRLVQYHSVVGETRARWPGAALWRSPNGLDPTLVKAWNRNRPTWGVCTTKLADYADALYSRDTTNSFTIRLLGGVAEDLVDSTDGLLFALGRPGGDWELAKFRDVTVGALANTYVFSNFDRGLRGTDVFTGGHTARDIFVLIKNRYVDKLYYQFSDLGDDYWFWAVGQGQNVPQVIPVQHTLVGAAERPYAPIVTAVWGGAESPTGLSLTWIRGSRIDGVYGNNTTLGETSQEYEIDLIDRAGSPSDDEVVLQSFTGLTTTTKFITAGEIIAAYGSLPSIIYCRVYQISQTLEAQNGSGRGYSRLTSVAT